MVCPPNTNSEPSWDKRDGERERERGKDGRMRGMQGREKCPVSAAHKAALAYL